MNPFIKAQELYKSEGYEIKTGLNPYRFNNYRDAPATIVFQNTLNHLPIGGDGIAISEVYFFQSLFNVYQPKTIFGIGNGYGWSSILFSLMNPDSNACVLDCGFINTPEKEDSGIDLTNEIAKKNDLKLKITKGRSPEDSSNAIVQAFQDDNIDFAFIDGVHTSDYIVKDFESIMQHLHDDSIVAFHDVLNFNMMEGIKTIASRHNYRYEVLHRTESGIVILYKNDLPNAIENVVTAFSESKMVLNSLKSATNRFKALQEIMPPILFRFMINSIIKIKRILRGQ